MAISNTGRTFWLNIGVGQLTQIGKVMRDEVETTNQELNEQGFDLVCLKCGSKETSITISADGMSGFLPGAPTISSHIFALIKCSSCGHTRERTERTGIF